MRRLLIYFFITCFNFSVKGQDVSFFDRFEKPKPYVALMGGYNFPVGIFTDYEHMSEYTMHPAPVYGGGSSFTPLTFGIPVIAWLGFSGGVFITNSHINETSYLKKWQNYRPELDWKVKVEGQYAMRGFMLGPFLTIPFKKFSIDAEILIGRANIHIPQSSVIGANRQTDARFGTRYERIITIIKTKYNAPVLSGSIGIRKPLTEKFALIAKAAYFEADSETYEIFDSAADPFNAFPYFTFNFTFGAAYDFTKNK